MSQFRPTLRPEDESQVETLHEQVLDIYGLNHGELPRTVIWSKLLGAMIRIHKEMPRSTLKEFYS